MSTTKVFVGNLSGDCAEYDIRKVFGKYGEIKEVALIKNFCFLHFVNSDDAQKAVDEINGTFIKGNKVGVELSKNTKSDSRRDRSAGSRFPSGSGGKPTKVFIGNLPIEYEKKELQDILEKFGKVEVDVVKNKDFAFAFFTDKDDATKAVEGLKTKKATVGGKQISVAIAQNANRDREIITRRDTSSNYSSRGFDSRREPNGPYMQPRRPDTGAADSYSRNPPAYSAGGMVRGQPAPYPTNSNTGAFPPTVASQKSLSADMEVRVRREAVPVSAVPNAAKLGLTDGYVIHERYYVKPNHPYLANDPLLKSLPPFIVNQSEAKRAPAYAGERSNYGRPAYASESYREREMYA